MWLLVLMVMGVNSTEKITGRYGTFLTPMPSSCDSSRMRK